MDLVDKVIDLIKKNNISRKDVATYIGMKAPHLSDTLNRKGRKFSVEHIPKLAKLFNVDESYLLGDESKTPVKKIPIIGTSSCGNAEQNFLQIEDSYCMFSADKWHEKLFCVVADGESMAPEIENGDQVICDPLLMPRHGDLAYYSVNGESAIKVFVENKDAGIVMLKPVNANEHFKTTVFRIDDDMFGDVKFAKVVGVNKTNFNNVSARLKLVGEQ